MVAAATLPAPRPLLLRYWTSGTRDHNGRLPDDLCIRIEWSETGVVRTACGLFTGESIAWAGGSPVPSRIDDLAVDAALDCGETTDYPYDGTESEGAMLAACERVCLGCGASVDSAESLSREGTCARCWVAGRAV